MVDVAYTVVIEPAGRRFSAYAPDLPGCVATGRTEKEVLRRMSDAIRLHLEGMIEDGDPIPEPRSMSRTIKTKLAVA